MTTQTQAVTKRQPLTPITADTVKRLDDATSFAVSAFNSQGSGSVIAALNVAQGIADLREMFDQPEIKSRILALQDKAIGFRTDKDPNVMNRKTNQPNVPYSWEVVKDCCIEATLRGLQLVGNQMNIISGRMYATKEGYDGLIRKLPNVSNFEITLNVPKSAGNGVLIECDGAWIQDGTARTIKATIPVKTDDYSTIEQSMGKATRKFLKRCYERMTGNTLSDGDAGEAGETIVADPPKPEPTEFKPRKPRVEKQATPAPEPTTERSSVVATTPQATPEAAQHESEADTAAVEMSELQDRFCEFCRDSGIAFDDAAGWLKTTGRYKGDDLAGFDEVPDAVISELLKAPNDVKKLVTLFGKK